MNKPFLPCLAAIEIDHWQKFSEQYPELLGEFVEKSLETTVADFKKAITLSDFILRSSQQAPEQVLALFTSQTIYQQQTPNYLDLLADQLNKCESEEVLHQQLRLFRLEQMVSIAFADMVLDISLDESLKRLSALADALILGALSWLSNCCYQKWGTPTNSAGETIPLLVYGMGKLGGGELNFSSDIDLIFAYPESGETQGGRKSIDNQLFFTRLAQKLITALNQQTADGFVYRVDMRLRPFGESGPLVLSFSAMEDYYQEQGRDWERYAMLKARLIGEGKYHKQLSSMLRPFVYRRYIDFSVIDSLRRMKMMIAQEVRRKNLTNNIKLGAGGIREVEFIVQVFQLIRGGRIKPLQQRSLLTVLPLLVEHQEITEHSKLVLENAYRFLRRVENILQALDDQQTQTLPDNALDQARLLYVLGDDVFPSWQKFIQYLNKLMAAVHQEFIVLIGEDSPNNQVKNQHWLALWDNNWPNEECIEWIEKSQPNWQGEAVWQLLATFRESLTKRAIGNRGRQILAKLIPLILSHIEQAGTDHQTLERILWVVDKTVTRTAYLELLYENEGALKHLVRLCKESAWLAEHIAKYPIILDELIDPKLLNNPPALSSYQDDLRQLLLRIPENDLELQMDSLRQFKQAQQLRIAAADIVGVLPVTKVSDHLSALAEAIVAEVVNMAWQQMSERYGVPSTLAPDDKGFAVIGYGKMGGIELGYSSDLDLVFVHNCDLNDVTNGNKTLAVGQYYAKLAQRIMHIFNTRMNSGILYELDMRLRPSGNSGVMVISLATFEQYQQKEAWTWEHQALVRARAIFGNSIIVKQFNDIRQKVLSKKRDEQALKKDVLAMRKKMRDHLDKSSNDFIDIKQGQGGLVDIEFLVQFLVLNHSWQNTEINKFSDNIRLLLALKKTDVISEQQQKILTQYYCQLRDHGHRAALQNSDNVLSNEQFSEIAVQVEEACQRFYHES